jgi:hypothetical protein
VKKKTGAVSTVRHQANGRQAQNILHSASPKRASIKSLLPKCQGSSHSHTRVIREHTSSRTSLLQTRARIVVPTYNVSDNAVQKSLFPLRRKLPKQSGTDDTNLFQSAEWQLFWLSIRYLNSATRFQMSSVEVRHSSFRLDKDSTLDRRCAPRDDISTNPELACEPPRTAINRKVCAVVFTANSRQPMNNSQKFDVVDKSYHLRSPRLDKKP